MKTFTLLLFFSLLTASLLGQPTPTAAEWQADLRYLQETVHKDYPFLFKKVDAETFDREVETLYKAIPAMEPHEVIVGLARIVSLFQYGHTSIGIAGWWEREAFNFHQLPFNLYQFSDGIYLQGVHKDYEKALGAKLIKIEGVPIEDAIAAIRPVVPVENDQYFKAFGLTLLGTPEVLHAQGITKQLQEKISLTLERDGKTFDLTFAPIKTKTFPGSYSLINGKGDWLDARDNTKTPHYLKNLDRIYYYEYLPEQKAVYVRHSQIQDDAEEAIPAFYERVFDFIEKNDVEKLILDVRLNGGGNNYKNKPVVTGIIRTEKINQVGKLFVIIGRRTFSACQNLVNELHTYTNAIFVGEPTAENINFYGDNRPVTLPNSKIPVRLSFAWWQDKPQWENGPWLAPHLAVDMSFEEYRSNQDPVLEAALHFSDDNFILNPINYFTTLFQTGKLAEIQSEAARMVKDPQYRFFDFNGEFNKVGYNLLGQNQLEPALFVFELNAKLFPDSANAWDSLGEACWKANQIDKAIIHYKKAIALDPNGSVGENARNMLKEIEKGK
ncbi:MAG: tetratricopeptide repeat protein [Saprospiraceae bacterium]